MYECVCVCVPGMRSGCRRCGDRASSRVSAPTRGFHVLGAGLSQGGGESPIPYSVKIVAIITLIAN